MIKTAQKALYAMVGAPVVAKNRVSHLSEKMVDGARSEYAAWTKEGEKVAKKVRSSEVVEEISSRVDVEQIQGQVEKLRDQLEKALTNWKDNFRPEQAKAPVKKAPARKPAAKATTKTATVKKAPARKPAAKATTKTAAAKKAPARKPAAKATTKTAAAKKAPARKPAATAAK